MREGVSSEVSSQLLRGLIGALHETPQETLTLVLLCAMSTHSGGDMSTYNFLTKKPQRTDAMPTMNDVYQLAERTDRRLDAIEDKLNGIEAELRVAIRGLMETFKSKP